jgi:hypothetical protein
MLQAMLRKLLLVDDVVDGAETAAILLRSIGLQVVVMHSACRPNTRARLTYRRPASTSLAFSSLALREGWVSDP